MENVEEIEYATEILRKKVSTTFKKYYGEEVVCLNQSSSLIKDYERYSIELPEEIAETFIPLDLGYIFWAFSNKLIKYLDEFQKHYTGQFLPQYREIIKEFHKWVEQKCHNNKRNASSNAFISGEDTYFPNNFFISILSGIVYLYDEFRFSPQRAEEKFQNGKENIPADKLTENYYHELLYFINLFIGFTHLRRNNFYEASNYFSEALKIKPHGLNAKFYLALSEGYLNKIDISEYYLRDIFNYDIYRIDHAIETLNNNLLAYYLKTPVFFQYSKSAINDEIFNTLTTLFQSYENSKIENESLNEKLNSLKELSCEKFFNDAIKERIKFVQSFNQLKNLNKNILYKIATDKLRAGIGKIVTLIKEEILKQQNDRLIEIGSDYDSKINKFNLDIDQRKILLEDNLKHLKNEYKEKISNKELECGEEIKILENKIIKLADDSKYNPGTAFWNTMTYNFILSSITFLMGGCAGYTSNFIGSIKNVQELIEVLIVYGVKWGLITFCIGVVIAFGASLVIIIRKSEKKNNMLNRITSLRNEKIRFMEHIKKESEKRESAMKTAVDKKREELLGKIERLKLQKLEEQQKAKAVFEESVKSELNSLNSFLAQIG